MLFSKTSCTAAMLLTFFLTASLTFLVFVVFALVLNLIDTVNHIRNRELSNQKITAGQETSLWQIYLLIGFSALTGVWCFLCFTFSDSLFVQLICIVVAIGYILSLISHSTKNAPFFTTHLCAVGIPLIAGVLTYADLRALILLAFLMPLFFTARSISRRITPSIAEMSE